MHNIPLQSIEYNQYTLAHILLLRDMDYLNKAIILRLNSLGNVIKKADSFLSAFIDSFIEDEGRMLSAVF
ncbi:hypothetical protein BCU12_07785 [Vibrio sp. 10N.261.55.A7]|nr:hypothetical protein BCU12_07785 [Vibrio sp. 10N.261.55.A7]